jgi:hypothetical protein
MINFPLLARCLTISNADSLSSIERGVYPGIRTIKKINHPIELDFIMPLVVSV